MSEVIIIKNNLLHYTFPMFDHPLEACLYRGHLTCYSSCTAAISGIEQAVNFFNLLSN